MRSIFGKLILAPVVMAAAALATTSASAETSAKVPFNFTVAGSSMPAGDYSIQKDSTGNTVTLRNKATAQSYTFLIGPGDAAPTDSNVTLKFDEFGAGHALRSIQYGAQVTSRTQVTGLLREGERVTGVRAVDLETGSELLIRAQQVVNATGVWTDEIQAMVGGRGSINVRASKGVHLVVPRDRIQSHTGIILRTSLSVLFVIPWGRHWIIGTTDTDWALSKAHPAASKADIDYVLSQINRVLAVPLTHDDVEGVYAGLRPLLAGESESTSKLSREHTVAHPVPGLVMIAGGKYTTYRLMARDAIDAVAHGLDGKVAPSCTDQVPLAGADGFQAMWNARAALAKSSRLHVARIEHLLRRYGTLIGELLDLIADDPSLGKPIGGADDYLRVEVVYAVTHEGARHLEDVLTRRTHLSIETWDRGLSSADEVAELMAAPMKWKTKQVARELENYRAEIAAERKSQEADTDTDADAIRLGAPDIVPVLANGSGH